METIAERVENGERQRHGSTHTVPPDVLPGDNARRDLPRHANAHDAERFGIGRVLRQAHANPLQLQHRVGSRAARHRRARGDADAHGPVGHL
ncbi:MAG: hypothetical protein R3B68_13425 [Phycisphaerales bacterium]